MFNDREMKKLLTSSKDFEEIHGSINGFITNNIDSIYVNTESLDYTKYVILLRQIIKKRLETKKETKVNFITKEIIIKRKDLTNTQLKALEWLFNNNNYLVWRTENLVKKYENGKIFKGSIRKQIDKYKAKHKDRYQETLKYNNIEKERGEAQK